MFSVLRDKKNKIEFIKSEVPSKEKERKSNKEYLFFIEIE